MKAKSTIHWQRKQMEVWSGVKRAQGYMGSLSPASAPVELQESSWNLWQLHCFDVHNDHNPDILLPAYPTTWARWFRDC